MMEVIRDFFFSWSGVVEDNTKLGIPEEEDYHFMTGV